LTRTERPAAAGLPNDRSAVGDLAEQKVQSPDELGWCWSAEDASEALA
jgi:hypothetical protein